GHEVLLAMEPGEELRDHRRPLPDGEIAEMPNHIVRSDSLVPALHHPLVHCSDRGKRAPVKSQSAAMTEMRVAGEEGSHSLTRRRRVRAAPIRRQCSCQIYGP